MLYLYQGGDNISECGGFFMVWLTKSKFLSLDSYFLLIYSHRYIEDGRRNVRQFFNKIKD
jgi:hypothetical protein